MLLSNRPDSPRRRFVDELLARSAPWYAGAVLVGFALLIVAALGQPFSYDELTQIRAYASNDVADWVEATRQPPLVPFVEGLIWHVLGEGQLQQRLLPVMSATGSLVVMSLLLRRLGAGRAGAFAVLVMATAPLFVRYGAYNRPYATTAFVMLFTAYAGQMWLETRQRRWLVAAGLSTLLLPFIRVPEPTVFIATCICALGWFAWRSHIDRAAAMLLMMVQAAVLLTAGLATYLSLERETGSVADLSLGGMASRFDEGLHEMVSNLPETLAGALPWWPFTVLVVVLALAEPSTRRRLTGWVWFWPLLAGPVAFVIAFHFGGTISFEALPYRERFASFFIAPLTLAVAALAMTVARDRPSLPQRLLCVVSVAGLLVTQLPSTARVLTSDAAPDFASISHVLTTQLPDDAIVLYDRTTPAGASRQRFLGTDRYMGSRPFTATVSHLPTNTRPLPDQGPVYLLFNGQCAYAGRCHPGMHHAIKTRIPGWHQIYRQDRFTLYAPDSNQSGREGAIAALTAAGTALGPDLGYVHLYAAAATLAADGRRAQGERLLSQLRRQSSSAVRQRMQFTIDLYHLDPFGLSTTP